MLKKIFITNGYAGVGKDTFAKCMNSVIPTCKFSSIDKVKEIASLCGWNGEKTEKSRKFLSDLKMITTDFNDMPFKSICRKIYEFLCKDDVNKLLLIDIREPKEIDKVKSIFKLETILITNNNVKQIMSNDGDKGVLDYSYDYIIDNSGSIDDLKQKCKEFVENYVYS